MLCGDRELAARVCQDAATLTYAWVGRARGAALRISLLRSVYGLSLRARCRVAPRRGRASGDEPRAWAAGQGKRGEYTIESLLVVALARLGRKARAAVWLRDAMGLTMQDATAVVRAAVPRFQRDLHLARAALLDLARDARRQEGGPALAAVVGHGEQTFQ